MRILIIDDHPVVREGLKRILSVEFEGAVIGEAQDIPEAAEAVRKEKWDLVVLDIDLPGRSGLELLRDLKRASNPLPVVVLSFYPEDQLALRTLRAGANAYLTKGNAATELVHTIKKILQGETYITASVAKLLARELKSGSTQAAQEALSDREHEVLCRIASGGTVKHIAAEFSLSTKTITAYRRRLLKKLRLNNDVEIARYAWQNGLVK